MGYEVGPARVGLARVRADAQIECVVAAPVEVDPSVGDRFKTDARDAAHLTRLLRLGEITVVTVADAAVEAVRDLVRPREEARADLMRVRHRLSKLPLRQGRVSSDGHAWNGVQGSITKAGPSVVDRVGRASPPALPAPQSNGASPATVDPALKGPGHAGDKRLHQQWCRFTERKKSPLVANVAIARETGRLVSVAGHLVLTAATNLDRRQPVDGEVCEPNPALAR